MTLRRIEDWGGSLKSAYTELHRLKLKMLHDSDWLFAESIGHFPSSLVPLFQSESKCETILMKMTLICMRMKLHAELIYIWKVSHLDSFWNRGTRELGNGLFSVTQQCQGHACYVCKSCVTVNCARRVLTVALEWVPFLVYLGQKLNDQLSCFYSWHWPTSFVVVLIPLSPITTID